MDDVINWCGLSFLDHSAEAYLQEERRRTTTTWHAARVMMRGEKGVTEARSNWLLNYLTLQRHCNAAYSSGVSGTKWDVGALKNNKKSRFSAPRETAGYLDGSTGYLTLLVTPWSDGDTRYFYCPYLSERNQGRPEV
jgi:hypothetical protein